MSISSWQKVYIYSQNMPVYTITLILQELHHHKKIKQLSQLVLAAEQGTKA